MKSANWITQMIGAVLIFALLLSGSVGLGLTASAGGEDVCEHVLKNGECSVCHKVLAKFVSAQVSIGYDLGITFTAKIDPSVSFTEVKAKFTRNGKIAEAAGTADGSGEYTFAYNGINPQCMGETVSAELILDGTTVYAMDYSVKQNVVSLLEKYAGNDTVVALLAETLRFGAAAQLFTGYKTDALVSDIVSDLVISLEAPAFTDHASIGPCADAAIAKIAGAGIYFDSAFHVYYTVKAPSIDGISAVIGGEECELVPAGDNTWRVLSAPVSITGIEAPVTVTLKNGTTALQTVSYGISDYIARMGGTDRISAEMQALLDEFGKLYVAAQIMVNDYPEELEGMVRITDMRDTYSAKAAGDRLLENALVVSADYMKGTHDASFTVIGNKAYIAYSANDLQAGENTSWDYMYNAMSIVNIETGEVEKILKFSESEQEFDNLTLPHGAAVVPRIVRLDENTLRVFFSVDQTSVPASQIFYIDFDLPTETFSTNVNKLQLKTANGLVDYTADAYYNEAISAGMDALDKGYGDYIFDIFEADGEQYLALNSFPGGQNSLGRFINDYTAVEIIGHIGIGSDTVKTSESGIIRLEDGTWMSIMREDVGKNCMFSYSEDGITWTAPVHEDFLVNGTTSKPILRNFGGSYFMGYNDTNRSVFKLLWSENAEDWTPLFNICSKTTFQYPTFDIYDGQMYYTATIGAKEQIVFGKMPIVSYNGELYIDDSAEDTTFGDLDSYTDLPTVQINQNGTTFDVKVKRDENGIYFHAESDTENTGDKMFFVLDTKGTSAYYGMSDSTMLIRLNSAEVERMSEDGTRGYVTLASFDGVEYLSSTENGKSYDLFIPYEAIPEISPVGGYTGDPEAPIYCAAYGANGSFVCAYAEEYSFAYAPFTFPELTAENTLVPRWDLNEVTKDGTIRCSASGAEYDVYMKRDANGIYLLGLSESKMVSNDKLILILDTKGTATTQKTNDTMMFRFQYSSSMQVQSYYVKGATTYKYVNMTSYPGVECTMKSYTNVTIAALFIPYDALASIAPNTTYTDGQDLFFSVHGAGANSYEDKLVYDGTTINWSSPSTYLIINEDNEIEKR